MAQTPVIEFDYGLALNQAYAALTQVITGGAIAELRDQNGEVIKYTAASRASLMGWIAYLEAKTGVNTGGLRPLGMLY